MIIISTRLNCEEWADWYAPITNVVQTCNDSQNYKRHTGKVAYD